VTDEGSDRSAMWSEYGYKPAPGAPIPNEDDSTDGDDERPAPTHECMCGRTQKHIRSAPVSEYSWCDECECVKRFKRIEDES